MKIKTLIIILLMSATVAFSQEPPKIEKEQELTQVLKVNAIELVDWAKQTAEKTGDFAAEQTPLFLQEYIQWQIWSNFIKVAFFIIFPLILIPLAVKFYRKIGGWRDDHASYLIEGSELIKKQFSFNNILFLIFGVSGIISSIVTLVHTPNYIAEGVKAMVAPRVVIVEKISELVKK